jgi:hypothetical protein
MLRGAIDMVHRVLHSPLWMEVELRHYRHTGMQHVSTWVDSRLEPRGIDTADETLNASEDLDKRLGIPRTQEVGTNTCMTSSETSIERGMNTSGNRELGIDRVFSVDAAVQTLTVGESMDHVSKCSLVEQKEETTQAAVGGGVTSKIEEDLMPVALKLTLGDLESPRRPLQQGDQPTLKGLKSGPLNGKRGTVTQFAAGTGDRVPIALDDSNKRLMVRPENLEKVDPARCAREKLANRDREIKSVGPAAASASTSFSEVREDLQHVPEPPAIFTTIAWDFLDEVAESCARQEGKEVDTDEVSARACQLVKDWIGRRHNPLAGSLKKRPSVIDKLALEFIETVDRWSDTQCALHEKRMDLEFTCLRCLHDAVTASLLVNDGG